MKQNYLYSFTLSLVMLTSMPAISQEQTLEKGEYLTETGSGRLIISGQKNKLFFSISTVGANGHVCDLSGEIRGNRAVLPEDEHVEPVCAIKFDKKGDVISVLPSDSCHDLYCGMRAYFGGNYFQPNKGCSSMEQGNRYEAFKALYDKRSYALALKESQTLLNDCKKFTDWIGKDNLKNDIAITQYHLADKAGCLSTLKSIGADSLEANLPPMETEIAASIVKAKNINLKLCKKLK